jgi:F-type H+-transporting ATPase subunit gamma
MPSLKAIRNRIQTVKNTQKITKAMKLVAAARLRRAQDALLAARPYAQSLEGVVAELAARTGDESHPLLTERPLNRILLVPITSDRGLAGGFNAQVTRAVERFLRERKADGTPIEITIIGRKGRDYLKRRKLAFGMELPAPTGPTALDQSRDLAHAVVEAFLETKADAVFIVYNEFKSAISQTVRVEQLLPIKPKQLESDGSLVDYAYEPSKKAVLDRILPLHAQIQVLRALLESVASEFGARMSAMDNATRNASDMISSLSLQYNRARQASITKELLEIIGGAEALKG